MRGHLFITRGDLVQLACDAILVPSGMSGGRLGHVGNEGWRPVLGDVVSGGFVDPAPSEIQRVVKVRAGTKITDPAVWVGYTGPEGQHEPTWYAEAITDFIRRAGREGGLGAPRPLDDPRPLLGIPLVGAGLGGADAVKGDVLLAHVSAVRRVLEDIEADVVLVLIKEEAFSGAQLARRRAMPDSLAWREIDDLKDVAVDLAERARNGALVAFVGAGAGIGAALPSWKELLIALADESGMDAAEQESMLRLDARDAGAVLEVRFKGRDKLVEAICERFGGTRRVSLLHQLLASLPVSEYVTTNYDTCLERALKDAGRPVPALPEESVAGSRRWLLKLHGSATPKGRKDIRLSRADYLRFDGEGTALSGIVQALLITRHMLFVGYSLNDDNFHRMLHQARTVIGPADSRPERGAFATALSPTTTGILDEVWEGDIEMVSTALGEQASPRRKAILLDRIAALAASPAGHLMDRRYEGLFEPGEKQVHAKLAAVQAVLKDSEVALPERVRSAVADALRPLGFS